MTPYAIVTVSYVQSTHIKLGAFTALHSLCTFISCHIAISFKHLYTNCIFFSLFHSLLLCKRSYSPRKHTCQPEDYQIRTLATEGGYTKKKKICFQGLFLCAFTITCSISLFRFPYTAMENSPLCNYFCSDLAVADLACSRNFSV